MLVVTEDMYKKIMPRNAPFTVDHQKTLSLIQEQFLFYEKYLPDQYKFTTDDIFGLMQDNIVVYDHVPGTTVEKYFFATVYLYHMLYNALSMAEAYHYTFSPDRPFNKTAHIKPSVKRFNNSRLVTSLKRLIYGDAYDYFLPKVFKSLEELYLIGMGVTEDSVTPRARIDALDTFLKYVTNPNSAGQINNTLQIAINNTNEVNTENYSQEQVEFLKRTQDEFKALVDQQRKALTDGQLSIEDLSVFEIKDSK